MDREYSARIMKESPLADSKEDIERIIAEGSKINMEAYLSVNDKALEEAVNTRLGSLAAGGL